VRALLAATTLTGAPLLVASATAGTGIAEVLAALRAVRDRVAVRTRTRPAGPMRLAIDRAFAVKGRGAVVTGSLRGSPIADGDHLRVEPGGADVRVRGLEVHHAPAAANESGRTAANLVGVAAADLRRGQVLTRGPGIESTSRLLVRLSPIASLGTLRDRRWPPSAGEMLRLHIGTDQVDATVRRRGPATALDDRGAIAAELSLDRPVATFVGDRAVLRRPSPGRPAAAVVVLDPRPPRGPSRRRATSERIAALDAAIADADVDAAAHALVGLHGALPMARIQAVEVALRTPGLEPDTRPAWNGPAEALVLAADVADSIDAELLAAVDPSRSTGPESPTQGAAGASVAEVRAAALGRLRRLVTLERSSTPSAMDAIDRGIEDLIRRGRLLRDGDRLVEPSVGSAIHADLAAAMDRLEAALAVPAPPPLSEAASAAGCPPDGIRALLAAGRITRLERDLAWATSTYHQLARLALDLAEAGPLTPAALRDATGTSRRFVLAILEDLDRREILRRTPAGHVPGPRAPRREPV